MGVTVFQYSLKKTNRSWHKQEIESGLNVAWSGGDTVVCQSLLYVKEAVCNYILVRVPHLEYCWARQSAEATAGGIPRLIHCWGDH